MTPLRHHLVVLHPAASSASTPPGDRPTIVLPDPSLVLLVGAAGAGKSMFARRRFAAEEIGSSDALRAALTGDATDQSRNRLVFALLHRDVERRLGAGLLTVVDATNVEWHARRPLLAIAQAARRPCVAIVLDLPLADVLARNRARADAVPTDAVERQHRRLASALERDVLAGEGYVAIHRLTTAGAVEGAIVVRVRLDEPPVSAPPPPRP